MELRAGVFQFTHWDRNLDSLISWFEWFRLRGVPAAIVMEEKTIGKEEKKENHFSIWRACWKERHRDSITHSSRNQWFEPYQILKECHGFSKHKEGK